MTMYTCKVVCVVAMVLILCGLALAQPEPIIFTYNQDVSDPSGLWPFLILLVWLGRQRWRKVVILIAPYNIMYHRDDEKLSFSLHRVTLCTIEMTKSCHSHCTV